MEIGAFFILIILLVVLVVLGGGVYAIAAYFRRQKLHPEEDRLEQKLAGNAGDEGDEPGGRPVHVKKDRPQRVHYVGADKHD
jgi:hypothetical protein